MKITRIVFVLLFFCLKVFPQKLIGEWQEHFSYNNAKQIVASDDRYLCLTTGGLYFYDLNYNQIVKLDKNKGVYGGVISAIGYNENTNEFYVGYQSGMIDIIKEDKITHIDYFFNSNSSNSKKINCFTVKDNKVFVSTSVGILVYDVQKMEFVDIVKTFYDAEVYKTVFSSNTLYAATSQGVFYVDYLNVNINDFANWRSIDGAILSKDVKLIQDHNGALYIGVNELSQSVIYKWDGSLLQLSYSSSETLKDLVYSDNSVLAVFLHKLVKLDASISDFYVNNQLNMNSVKFDNVNRFVVADSTKSMVVINNGVPNVIVPNGPELIPYGAGISAGEKVLFTSGFSRGGEKVSQSTAGIFCFQDNLWNSTIYHDKYNFTSIAVSDKYPDNIFAGSYSEGVYKIVDNDIVNHYSFGKANSVVDMKPDNRGNIWIANSKSINSLYVLSQNGEYLGFDLSSYLNGDVIRNIQISKATGYVMIIVESKSYFFVFDDNNTPFDADDDRVKKVYLYDENHSAFNEKIMAVTEDIDGEIWFATTYGVLVSNTIRKVFDELLIITHPIVTDEKGHSDYLLYGVDLNDIDVDAANCKWVCTNNYGVYKISPSGSNVVYRFMTNNSSLPSNVVNDIVIDHSSGNVFMNTDYGLVSYKDNTIKSSSDYSNMYVYPNPVRPDYSGPIVIKGLIENSLIKITDSNGNIAFESYSSGGELVWDGNDLNGKAVRSGVYLIFASGNVGQNSKVIKLLIVR